MRTFALLLTVFAGACLAGHIGPPRQEWNGRHASDLIAEWGPPQAVLRDRHGGRILVYVKDREGSTRVPTPVDLPGVSDTTGALAPPVTQQLPIATPRSPGSASIRAA